MSHTFSQASFYSLVRSSLDIHAARYYEKRCDNKRKSINCVEIEIRQEGEMHGCRIPFSQT